MFLYPLIKYQTWLFYVFNCVHSNIVRLNNYISTFFWLGPNFFLLFLAVIVPDFEIDFDCVN